MLLIEKIIKLLDDFHYQEFREYLKNISKRSYYPLALVDVIDRDIEKEQDPDYLCQAVYGDSDPKTKKKFAQLGHHTFKLTAFLARNYPDYLYPNINLVQRLINQQQVNRAILLADVLLEVCQKIEDFHTESRLLKIQSQLNVLFDSTYFSLKLQERIGTLLEYQKDVNDVAVYFLTYINPKNKVKKEDTDTHAAFFEKYLKHPSTSLRLLSTYYYCYTFYLLRDERFFTPEKYQVICQLEIDLSKFDYIIFPYLVDCQHNVAFLKMTYQIHQLDSDSVLQEVEQLIDNKDAPLYLKSLVNNPELFSLAIQSSYYITNYMKGYRDDRNEVISKEVQEKLNFLKKRCQEILENRLLEERFTLRYINLTVIYAGFLLCGDKKDIKNAIETLEGMMLSYQQIPFHFILDAIYSIILVAHFCLQQYSKIDDLYKRYKRATKNKAVNSENDNTIHGFFYAAKWLQTKRPQYAQKFNAVIQQSKQQPNLQKTQKILVDIGTHYNII